MPKPFKVSIRNETTGEEVTLEGAFPEDDWSLLSGYLAEAERLQTTRLMREGCPLNYSIKWTKDSGLTHRVSAPAADDVAALLHRMRPFLLNDEPYNFGRICNVLAKHLNHPLMHAVIKKQQVTFRGRDQGFTIAVNDEVLNSEPFLNTWLNAEEYHRDSDKAQVFGAISKVIPPEAARALLLSMLLDRAHAILMIANLIYSLRERQGRILKLPGLRRKSAT